ncbi:MAG TPA: alpha/beta hydrolase [Verrucomicrobiae bacterium]
MRARLVFILILVLAGVLTAQTIPVTNNNVLQRRSFVYREVDGQKLNAYVFQSPGENSGKPTAAVLLFHGGGWVAGKAGWTSREARRFAALGLTAVTVDYRLSAGTITPIKALDDTRAAFRWMRRYAVELNIDPRRVAGYGVSAGGYLVAAAATLSLSGDGIDGTSSKPDLLLLWSPALDVAANRRFVKLLQGRASAADYSPLEHAGASTPPTCIVNGDKDRVTPLAKAEQFRDRVVQAGGICELHAYAGVGHLLPRNLANQGDNFDPDPKSKEAGLAQFELFLRARGYLPGK